MTASKTISIGTVGLRGRTKHTISVAPAPVEPAFGMLSLFSAERREHLKKRRAMIKRLKRIIETEDYDNNRDKLFERIKNLDTYTLEVILREVKKPASTAKFLMDTIRYPQTSIRELATFRSQFPHMSHRIVLTILDTLRLEANPLFAHEDLSGTKEDERHAFNSLIGFYLGVYGALIDHRQHTQINSFSADAATRHRVLNKIPAFTPSGVVLIVQNAERHDDLIRFVTERCIKKLDAESIGAYLNAPARAISEGML
jgi:hypothetical protein